ncbi:MAG TPA: GNAT family N-acetyltransferase [Steroidobacteraceae bacterium]|nr:GNAT family N-acetyltransferase [Steroidobacteraceae bacterium]
MSAEIRPATVADVPALVPLVEQYWLFEDIAHFERERVGRELSRALSDPALMSGWIARARGEAVGYLLAVYVFSLEHLGLTAEIDEFFVLPSARGHGTGDELLRLAEAEFHRRGCTNVFLQIGKGNDRARVFYRDHGFDERAGFDLLDKMIPERKGR